MNILNFGDFINEKYLKGGRAPLYKYLNGSGIKSILDNDRMWIGSQAENIRGQKSSCWTRDANYTQDGMITNFRIKVDVDELKRHGYNPVPVDEVGLRAAKLGRSNIYKGKPNIEWTLDGRRPVPSGLDIPKKDSYDSMEFEFEERFHKEIENLGKYIISIGVSVDNTLNKEISEYLQKYPHIKVEKYSKTPNKLHITTDITDEFLPEKEKEKVVA